MTIKGLYTNHAGTDILSDCAQALVRETNHNPDLRAYTILLPTRRAIRHFEMALIKAFDCETILLPRIMAIGDVDSEHMQDDNDDDFRLSGVRVLDGIERISSLIPFIKDASQSQNDDHSHARDKTLASDWQKAKEILKLIDLLQTENKSPKDLKDLNLSMDLAEHWQNSGGQFVAIAEKWLGWLEDNNYINKAEARIKKIEQLADYYHKNTPQNPVWFIGSTGSIPAVRHLMRMILSLEHGAILLPGVDTSMDEPSWMAISEAHPQAILKHTLSFLGYDDRRHIQFWPYDDIDQTAIKAQQSHISNALSPTPEYKKYPIQDLTIIEAANRQEEINALVQLCIEEKTATPDKHIVIVSNDPNLALKLTSIMEPYGFIIDASSGIPLFQTSIGLLMHKILNVYGGASDHHILDFWSLIKHPYCFEKGDFWGEQKRDDVIQEIENDCLRDAIKQPETLHDLLTKLSPHFQNSFQDKARHKQKFSFWARYFNDLLQSIITPKTRYDQKILEQVLDGLTAIESVKDSSLYHPIDATRIILDHISTITIRENDGLDPKRTILVLGTLEARMMKADLTILANLNENIWPDLPQPNAYLSRGMRHTIDLPDSERHAALSGHDFYQAFLSGEIVISYAKRDGDTPSLPSRWIMRLKAVSDPDNWAKALAHGHAIIERYYARHHTDEFSPAIPPAPKADISQAPKTLFVTHVELWRHDPYSFWAKHILRLKSLRPFLGSLDAAARGSIWHDIMKEFVSHYKSDQKNEDNELIFDNAVKNVLEKYHLTPSMNRLWQSRLMAQKHYILSFEKERQHYTKPWKLEEKFTADINNITVAAKADRVDIDDHNNAYLVDYKTGAMPTLTSIKQGFSCQLSLLSLLLPNNCIALDYIDIKGGRRDLKPVHLPWSPIFDEETRSGFSSWYHMFFTQKSPFISYADMGKAHHAKAQDYLDLACYDEWGAGATEGDAHS